MSKKIQTNKKLYVALPLNKISEGEIGYISSDYIALIYDEDVVPEVHQFIISKRASYIKFPDPSFDLKVTRLNGELHIDESVFYSNNAILKPIPSFFYEMKYYYYAQKINYAYFTRKSVKRRLSFLTCIDELLMLSDAAYKYGKLDQEDQERFDYLIGWAENKFPQWAEKLSVKNTFNEIGDFEEDLYEIHKPYKDEHIDEPDYHPCDLAMVVFLNEIVETLEKKILVLVKNTPKLILDIDEENQSKLILILQNEQAWETLAAIRDVGVKIPE